MKKILIFTIFAFVLYPALCLATELPRETNLLKPSVAATVANDGFPNIFKPFGDLFKRIFRKERSPIDEYTAIVSNLDLSQTEIISACSINDLCLNNSRKIVVSTQAVNPASDVLTYSYVVTAGKIVGLNDEEVGVPLKDIPNGYLITKVKKWEDGAKVIWDLSGVKAGTYSITTAVDDGCGFCGATKTQSVTIKECPDCKDK